MTIKTFSDGEAILFGWKTMKDNLGLFIGILITMILVNVLPDIMGEVIEKKIPVLSIIIYVAFGILHLIITMGFLKIVLGFCDNEKPGFVELFSCYRLFFKYLFSTILYMLIVSGGLILLIVPGIIWSIKFQFYPYFIIDKGMGPVEALKASASITQGAKWELLGFGLIIGIINLLGALCLVIGLFATLPTTWVAYAFVYRKLLEQTEMVQLKTLLINREDQISFEAKKSSKKSKGIPSAKYPQGGKSHHNS